jgi:formate hydrogenlyase subunit 3/multisubunit Na+/H+ antiporter MnhD subunit
MVAELHWFAVGAFSMFMTAAWLFSDRRITITGLFSAIGWSWMAVTGGDITRYTESGTEIALSVDELQYLCSALALLSFLAVVLYQFDHYPPRADNPTEVDPDVR